jgi:hypothetical protein
MATETQFGGVPVLAFVAHLALVDANGFAAGVAVLGEHGVEAVEAVRAAVTHNVPLASELPLALGAGEVLHVPSATLGLRAFVGEDDLEWEKKMLFMEKKSIDHAFSCDGR